MKNKQPLGNPKYNQGLAQVNCENNVSISCDENDNRVLVLKENDELCEKMLASSVLLCVKNAQEDCQEESDYRRANDFQKSYVNIKFQKADCSKKHYETANYSVFPKEGQTAEDLKKQLLELINACVDCNCPEPVDPALPLYEDIQTDETPSFVTNQTAFQTVIEKEVVLKAGKKYKLDFTINGGGDFGETVEATAAYQSDSPFVVAGRIIGIVSFSDTDYRSGHWSFETPEDMPEGFSVNLIIRARSVGGGDANVFSSFLSIQEVADVVA